MFEEGMPKVARMTLYAVIKNLEKLRDIPAPDFFDAVEEAFNGYNYEGEDELTGHHTWPDLHQEGDYMIPIRPDHEDAYELTLHITCHAGKVTVTNVL